MRKTKLNSPSRRAATTNLPGISRASIDLATRVHQVLFSPVFPDPAGKWDGLNARDLAEWILADGLPVRLGLQLHKFIWDPAMKGV